MDIKEYILKISNTTNANERDVLIKGLIKKINNENITEINTQDYSDVGINGIVALAEVLTKTNICTLNISFIDVKDDGYEVLIKALPKTNITSLNIDYEYLHDGFFIELAKVLPETRVNKFDFSSSSFNALTDDVFGALQNALSESIKNSKKNVAQFETLTNLIEYEVQDGIQEESKQNDQIIDTSSSSKTSRIEFNQIKSNEQILSLAKLIVNISLQPEVAIPDIKTCRNYTKEQIEDFIDNIIPDFISLLGNDVVSNVEILKMLYEKRQTEFCRLIIEHRDDKFDVEENIMHPYMYNLMHDFAIASSATYVMSDNASKLLNMFSEINKESKKIISDEDLQEFSDNFCVSTQVDNGVAGNSDSLFDQQ